MTKIPKCFFLRPLLVDLVFPFLEYQNGHMHFQRWHTRHTDDYPITAFYYFLFLPRES